MDLLVDTQVFIWLVEGDKRLGKKANKLLRDPLNCLYISFFSVYEMTIKASVGKLTYDARIIDDLPAMGLELLLPSKTTLQNYQIFTAQNKDPFDNALLAVALQENCSFVTADDLILKTSFPKLKLIDATK